MPFSYTSLIFLLCSLIRGCQMMKRELFVVIKIPIFVILVMIKTFIILGWILLVIRNLRVACTFNLALKWQLRLRIALWLYVGTVLWNIISLFHIFVFIESGKWLSIGLFYFFTHFYIAGKRMVDVFRLNEVLYITLQCIQ